MTGATALARSAERVERATAAPSSPRAASAERRGAAILVPDAHTRASLAAIRSLGRAGYFVHAASPMPTAIGLRSRYAAASFVSPPPEDPNLSDWLLDHCRRHDIRMIVPTSRTVAAALGNWEAFRPLLPITDDADIARRIFNKGAVFERYRDAGLLNHHPATLLFDQGETIGADAVRELRAPYFIKAAAQDAKQSQADLLIKADRAEDAARLATEQLSDYRRVMVQGAAAGRQVGVSVLRTPAGATVVNCVIDGHAKPHSNGTMSLRYSWWHDRIVADALRRLEALDWIGCAMVEYVWDAATDDFSVIEVNPRFWQYLHLDLHAGVDFPRLLARWFLEGVEPVQPAARLGVGCRDLFPGEVAMLVTRFRDADASLAEKARALGGFIVDSLRPSLTSDLSFPGDRTLFFSEALRFVRSEAAAIGRKLRR